MIPIQSILQNKKEDFESEHFYLKTYRWELIHVSKFCYKQPILQLSCYWVLSSKNFYIVERSSIECQEEASGAAKSRLVLILNLIDLDSGACFLDPIQSEIKQNQSKWTTLDAYSKIAPRCYSLDNYQITTIWSFSIRKLDNNFS